MLETQYNYAVIVTIFASQYREEISFCKKMKTIGGEKLNDG